MPDRVPLHAADGGLLDPDKTSAGTVPVICMKGKGRNDCGTGTRNSIREWMPGRSDAKTREMRATRTRPMVPDSVEDRSSDQRVSMNKENAQDPARTS